MTYNDVTWWVDFCSRRYPKHVDLINAELWLRNRVLAQPAVHLAIRTDNAACITALQTPVWFPADWEAWVMMIGAEDKKHAVWEAQALLRISRGWAISRRCRRWKVASETQFDVGPLAKRLGAHESKIYVIEWSP